MPSKIQLDENLWFLYICLQKSDYKAVGSWRLPPLCLSAADANGKIDFNAVGDATRLKPPAARMRYTRLRRAIEGGTLIGTHGIPFQGGGEKVVEVRKKRRGLLHSTHTDEVDDLEPLVTRSRSRIMRMEKVEDGSADEYDMVLSTEDEKASSVRRRCGALKRKVDAEDGRPGLASAPLRSGERQRVSGPHTQTPSPKVERTGVVYSKNIFAVEGNRHFTNGNRGQTGARHMGLAPSDIQQPAQAFRSRCEKGLTLKRETDGTLSTEPTATQTSILPKLEDRETK